MPSRLTLPSASLLWVCCVKRVQDAWEVFVQVYGLSHRPLCIQKSTWTKPTVLHGLYHFCTQRFTTFSNQILSLLFARFSTVSTQPINITTTYINNI